MRFSIITPTLQRESLTRCVQSVMSQTHEDFELLLQLDGPYAEPENRIWIHPDHCCGTRHNNFGNTCRHLAWARATGDYIIHLDDDNYFADHRILADIDFALEQAGRPDVACFPIFRHGRNFFDPNPRSCHADTANMVVKREYAQWPDRPEYTADGFWIDALRANPSLTFESFGQFRPIIVMESSGLGQ